MKRKLGPEDWEKIVLLRALGKTIEETAETLDIGSNAVNVAYNTLRAVQKGDWKKVQKMIYANNCSYELVDWCCHSSGKPTPSVIREWYEDNRKTRNENHRVKKQLHKQSKEQQSEQQPEQPEPEYPNGEDYLIGIGERLDAIINILGKMTLQIVNGQRAIYDKIGVQMHNDEQNYSIVCGQLEKLVDIFK